MVELKNKEQLSPAIERAHHDAKNLLVKMTEVQRLYRVVNRRNGYTYTVSFYVREDGRRFGHCTCKAGEVDMICKHLAAAAALNTYLAEQGLLDRRVVRSLE